MWYEEVIDEIPNWLDRMYNKEHSAYRLSEHSFYEHSIDSTSLALDLRQMLNMPVPDLAGSLAYFDERQNQETGFYYEDYVDTLDTSVDRMLEIAGTYLGFQVAAIYLHYQQSAARYQ